MVVPVGSVRTSALTTTPGPTATTKLHRPMLDHQPERVRACTPFGSHPRTNSSLQTPGQALPTGRGTVPTQRRPDNHEGRCLHQCRDRKSGIRTFADAGATKKENRSKTLWCPNGSRRRAGSRGPITITTNYFDDLVRTSSPEKKTEKKRRLFNAAVPPGVLYVDYFRRSTSCECDHQAPNGPERATHVRSKLGGSQVTGRWLCPKNDLDPPVPFRDSFQKAAGAQPITPPIPSAPNRNHGSAFGRQISPTSPLPWWPACLPSSFSPPIQRKDPFLNRKVLAYSA